MHIVGFQLMPITLKNLTQQSVYFDLFIHFMVLILLCTVY